MKIPLFLEQEYNEMNLTTNAFQKFHKLIHFNLKVMKYITILLYCDSSNSSYKTQKADKLLVSNFQTPTEGQWLSLLELLLSVKSDFFTSKYKIIKKNISDNLLKRFTKAFSIIIDNVLFHQEDISIYNYFNKIITIKNRHISHGIISEEKAIQINKELQPVTENIIEQLKMFFDTPIFLYEEESTGESCFFDIHNPENIEKTEYDLKEGLNAIIGNKVTGLTPFLLCRDGNIYFYNKFEKKNSKIHYSGPVGKETYKKTFASDIYEIFNLDKESLFIRSLDNKVKVSSKGVTSNLPLSDYNDFIGRNYELNELERMICHKRHFLTALDGIGGVGKTAIAFRFCELISEVKHYDRVNFDYIVWLSAKTTRFINGEIQNIDQSFEHLEQLIDTILDVLGFVEYKTRDIKYKKSIVYELLEMSSTLIILDNLETVTSKNIKDIWNFINDIPNPSKVLFTSREYTYEIPQILRIENLTDEDAKHFIKETVENLGNYNFNIQNLENKIVELSSGLPIALKSIIGQIAFGKNIRSIERAIASNTNDLATFCFQEQLKKLGEDHLKVTLVIALSIQVLSEDSLSFILGDMVKEDIDKIIKDIRTLSIIKRNIEDNEIIYSMLPLVKKYVLSYKKIAEYIDHIQKRLSDFYSLNETEPYSLLPIEERTINKGSLFPRKLVDKAMKHAENEEMEQADSNFKNCIKEYPQESYVWYIYSLFQSQYMSKYEESISSLKQAISLDPNYIYYKKIGDLHVKLKNFDTAIKYYSIAKNKSEINKNKDEMEYLIGNATFFKVKLIRKKMRVNRTSEMYEKRNQCYEQIIIYFNYYLKSQPSIYDGKRIRIYRILSESYFGLKQYEKAETFIDKAIDLSEYDDTHAEYRQLILKVKKKNDGSLTKF